MLNQLRNKILTPTKSVGLELTFLPDDSLHINCIILEIKKGTVIIEATFYNLKSFSELQQKVPANIPIALVLNGKGLIHKKNIALDGQLHQDILPGVNPNDLIFQTLTIAGNIDIAIIKKNKVETIINQLNDFNIYVTSLSLAFYDLSHIADLIKQDTLLSTTQYKIGISNKQIFNYETTDTEEKEILVKPEINIGSEYIKSNFVIPYAAAIKQFSGGTKNNNIIDTQSIIDNKNRLRQGLLLKAYVVSFLGGILMLLLINFFIYNSYFKKNNTLLSSYQFSLQQGARYDSLKKQLSGKKEFLSKAGWLDDSKMISFYSDRIAATVPDSVMLLNLNIYPAINKFSSGIKQWNFQQDTIMITGSCNDPSILDNWINEIGEIKNIKQAKINSYVFKKQGRTGFFNAEVLVK